MLKAVLFDFGNTLVSTNLDWASIVPRELDGLKRALEPHLGEIDWPRLGSDFLFLRKQARERASQTLREVTAADCLRTALGLQGLANVSSDILQAGVDGFFDAEEAAYPVIFGIPEVLAKLKEMGLGLAVVSNATCGRLIRRALERRRLLGYFDQVVVSADIGIRKPDPEIFLLAARSLDCPPQACAMVGDDLEADCGGAKQAGMRAVLACFLGQPEPDGAISRSDVVVRVPSQLVELFGEWRDPD